MSKEPGREQNRYPVSKLGWFTGRIREGVEATRRQLELLQPARARPAQTRNARSTSCAPTPNGNGTRSSPGSPTPPSANPR